jgi:hypothetical protein
MSRSTVAARVFFAVASLAGFAATAGAQTAQPRHPAVCGQGVRIYEDRAKLPAQRDSIAIPRPPGGQIRVNSPEEAEAAEMALRERAGSVGATSLLILTETDNDTVRRSVSGFFIVADSVRAAGICKKS